MEDENNISTRTVVKDFICEICYYLRKKGTELVLNSLSKRVNECLSYIGENNNNSMTDIGWKTLEAVIYIFGSLIEYIHFSIYIILLLFFLLLLFYYYIGNYKPIINQTNQFLQKCYTLSNYPYLVRQSLLYILLLLYIINPFLFQ